jgi:uncharacterized C2H2 Zn-finger protein
VTWRHLCTHTSLEEVPKHLEKTETQLIEIELHRAAKNLQYCSTCDKTFHSREKFFRHLRRKSHKERAGIAESGEPAPATQKRSARNPAAKGNYYCPICNQAFTFNTNFKVHLKTAKHLRAATTAPNADTDIPKERARIHKSLQWQKRSARNLAAKRYYCPICNQAFPFDTNLKRHLKSVKHLQAARLQS